MTKLKLGHRAEKCPNCGGSGKTPVYNSKGRRYGRETCSKCGGSGVATPKRRKE